MGKGARACLHLLLAALLAQLCKLPLAVLFPQREVLVVLLDLARQGHLLLLDAENVRLQPIALLQRPCLQALHVSNAPLLLAYLAQHLSLSLLVVLFMLGSGTYAGSPPTGKGAAVMVQLATVYHCSLRRHNV